MAPRPVVWESATLFDLIRYLLSHQTAPATVVVCSSRAAFLDALRTPLNPGTPHGDHRDGNESSSIEDAEATDAKGEHWHAFTRSTLQLLSASKNARLAFCPDVTHLRAYLTTYLVNNAERKDDVSSSRPTQQTPLLVILNFVQVHRQTSTYSAQGLNRTFANAVEAALRTNSQLLVVEYPLRKTNNVLSEASQETDYHGEEQSPVNWNEEISIINVTTKSFGVGDRGWAGRTVTIRSILERWCTFKDLT